MEFTVPEMIDTRYRVLEKIGSGAMASVYSAEDTRLGRQVALKILRPDQAAKETFRARFQREAEAVASLNHPSVVSVYDTGSFTVSDKDTPVQVPFMVMELIKGKTLRAILTERGELPIPEALSYASQILEALQYAGSCGIVHRDIKPANVMVLPQTDEDLAQDQPGRIKVMDFGIASALTESGEPLTQANTVMGTARYIAPEQARGQQVDSRSDIYSAACLIYEMLAGRSPFDADSNIDLAAMHLNETALPPSSYAHQHIPEAVDAVLLKALSKEPAERYQSADAFRTSLATAVQESGAAALTAPATAPVTTAFDQTQDQPATAAYTQLAPHENVEETGLGGFFDNAQAEYTDDELYAYERNEELAKKKRRKQAWTRVITGMVIAALAIFSISIVLYYQSELNRVPTHEVPAIQGMSRDEAETTIRNLNLTVAWEKEYSETVEKNTVIKTSPVTGTEVDEGSTVTITLSDGPAKVSVPGNLEGQSESYVRSVLEEAGFTAGRTSTVNSPTVPTGMVVTTEPGTGESVDAGATIDIILSTGKVEVPNVTGMSREDAIAALQAPNVMLSTNIETVQSTGQPAGTVISQSAAGGTSIEQGSTVTIRVATSSASASPSRSPSGGGIFDMLPGGDASPSSSPSSSASSSAGRR